MGSKKHIKQDKQPGTRSIVKEKDPDSFYAKKPSWCFCNCDEEKWVFGKNHIGEYFWETVFPRLKDFERSNWQDILIRDKKLNHAICVADLNKCARDRLAKRHIEGESIYSLRVNSTHRIYGILDDSKFCILWYDDEHGDNDTCVCRSNKKNT